MTLSDKKIHSVRRVVPSYYWYQQKVQSRGFQFPCSISLGGGPSLLDSLRQVTSLASVGSVLSSNRFCGVGIQGERRQRSRRKQTEFTDHTWPELMLKKTQICSCLRVAGNQEESRQSSQITQDQSWCLNKNKSMHVCLLQAIKKKADTVHRSHMTRVDV